MSFGIYKPGQGYWVRVMTAVFAGVLILAAAAWALQQAELIKLPTPTWNVTLSGPPRALQAGETLDMVTPEGTPVGAAVVEEYTTVSSGASVVVGSIELVQGQNDISSAGVVQTADGSFRALVTGTRGIPVFEPIYLQAAIAGVVLLVGAFFVYYFVAIKRQSIDFLIATDGEMKKVNWSTRKDVFGSTMVVIVASFLIATSLFVVDIVFQQFFTFIGVLRR